MEPLTPPLPTFLIIGAQKSATRWLRLNLGLHPDVFSAATEVEFFNNGPRFRDEGTDWYRDQFSGWSGEAIAGEATPGYMFWRHGPAAVAERIAATVPEARPAAAEPGRAARDVGLLRRRRQAARADDRTRPLALGPE